MVPTQTAEEVCDIIMVRLELIYRPEAVGSLYDKPFFWGEGTVMDFR